MPQSAFTSRVSALLGALLLGLAALTTPAVHAQADRLTYRYIAATQEWLPYIRWSAYRNISLNGGVTFENLLATPSLDTLTARLARSGFGRPREVERQRWGEEAETEYTATLYYEGATVEVRKIRGEVLIRTLSVTSDAHYLRINSVEVRPGMEVSGLSKETRKGIENGAVSIKIAEETEDGLSGVSEVRGIAFFISDDGARVTKIRFHRIA